MGRPGPPVVIWFGFLAAYQLARGATDRDQAKAFANGKRIVNLELHISHRLYELTIEQFVQQRHWLAEAVSWTYWNSEFTVVGLALLWVYIAHHERFTRFRNSILLANVSASSATSSCRWRPRGCSGSASSTAIATG